MSDQVEPAGRSRKRAVGKRAESMPSAADPVEIAMEAEASGKSPEGVARQVLEGQVGLIAQQTRLAAWQIASERAGVALKALTGVVGLLAAVVVTAVLWSAIHYRGLTIQPFSVPPDLEARGLTGSAVATRVLDKLSGMQDGTHSFRAPSTYSNSWGDDIEIEIPETGVSAGQLWKFLRSWLGEEVKITGEVVRTSAGLQISTRSGGHSASVVVGPEADLEQLLDKAAEHLYANTQPYRYAIYLRRTDRQKEAEKALLELTSGGNPVDRKWAFSGLASMYIQEGRIEESLDMVDGALTVDPDFAFVLTNRSNALDILGQIEGAYGTARRVVAGLGKSEDLPPARRDNLLTGWRVTVLAYAHDHAAGAALSRSIGDYAVESYDLAALHDVAGARRISRALPDNSEAVDMLAWNAALAVEDWDGLARVTVRTAATASKPDLTRRALTKVMPMLAYARARLGDIPGAEAALAGTPLSSWWVLIARGQVAAIKGDVAVSERWFERAAAAAPSLADANLAWGRARLDRRDWAGAIEKYGVAAKTAPRWADPLKGWGDALAGQGNHRAALVKYAAAAQRAPRWGGLHLAWGRSLAALGRKDEALAKWRAATGMDLNAPDRAAVARLLAG